MERLAFIHSLILQSSRTADPGGNKPTGLLTLPCLDSADHAQRCRARLSLPRTRARAQEEVLCRSSALFATLRGDPMYAHHAQRPLPDSTHWAILSPEVPVFRTDEGTALEEPWHLSIVTCAAPYVPGVGQPLAGDLLQARIERVLAIAQAFGYETLVLGAWGCGAFENDPRHTAEDFHAALEGRFAGASAMSCSRSPTGPRAGVPGSVPGCLQSAS
nr:TIGR02452 family protein [Halochromatium roseum]